MACQKQGTVRLWSVRSNGVGGAGQRHRKFPGQVPSLSAARLLAGLSTMNYGIKCGVVKNGKILCCMVRYGKIWYGKV